MLAAAMVDDQHFIAGFFLRRVLTPARQYVHELTGARRQPAME
jgi:hypothetical protein